MSHEQAIDPWSETGESGWMKIGKPSKGDWVVNPATIKQLKNTQTAIGAAIKALQQIKKR